MDFEYEFDPLDAYYIPYTETCHEWDNCLFFLSFFIFFLKIGMRFLVWTDYFFGPELVDNFTFLDLLFVSCSSCGMDVVSTTV